MMKMTMWGADSSYCWMASIINITPKVVLGFIWAQRSKWKNNETDRGSKKLLTIVFTNKFEFMKVCLPKCVKIPSFLCVWWHLSQVSAFARVWSCRCWNDLIFFKQILPSKDLLSPAVPTHRNPQVLHPPGTQHWRPDIRPWRLSPPPWTSSPQLCPAKIDHPRNTWSHESPASFQNQQTLYYEFVENLY